ncbi:MAG: ClpXP protease specificity-enhancing factor [Gammaproteobacteria bacterium]|nr:ClpXP protease specificity-enhancing factor [Gammaproteobacteria bacterium]MYC25158.1 ClpXP protease specificity-enhancing factor [Gammaproteobacteria bacterium]
MTSFRSYLVDALIQWLLDNECVPHIVLQCDQPDVKVPQEFVRDNRLVLNVAPSAVHNYSLTNSSIAFDTRFSGVSHHISAPIGAIVGVCARGSSVGMMFEPEVASATDLPDVHTQARAKFQFVE